MDPELENLPTDYENGLDFVVNKTSKGGYADYSTSKWARKENALTVDEVAAIEKNGLFNLSEFLPKRPSKEELDIIVDMFHASVDGESYDPEKWAKFYKPAGYQSADTAETTTTEAAPAPAPAKAAKPAPAPAPKSEDFDADEDDTPVATAPVKVPAAAAAGGSRAEDILAMIRNRQKTA
jgi:hypothetical protein